jgi:hypothetical protein
MTTVVRRTFTSTPGRDAMATWTAIVDLLTGGKSTSARQELLAVAGVDAIEGSDANEDALGFDPLNGDWRVSLPCLADDLGWVQGALKKHSERITARALGDDAVKSEAGAAADAAGLVFDQKGFLGT